MSMNTNTNTSSSLVHHDPEGDKLGMWLFLYSEILLFSGLFILYAMYLAKYHTDFVAGAKNLNVLIGTVNTFVLIVSSALVSMSITSLKRQAKKQSLLFLGAAIVCAVIFLVNKYFEWEHKIHMGIYPHSEFMQTQTNGLNIFYSLYYMVTGLHGLHLIVGGSLLTYCFIRIALNKITASDSIWLENVGLYWHLVDLIWTFVFPLFYLMVR